MCACVRFLRGCACAVRVLCVRVHGKGARRVRGVCECECECVCVACACARASASACVVRSERECVHASVRTKFFFADPVIKFLTTLSSVDEVDGFLSPPEGTGWFGQTRLHYPVYIRNCYKGLWVEVKKLEADMNPRVVITGNPGIGKTHFLLYILRELLQAGRKVLLHISAMDAMDCYFCDGGNISLGPFRAFQTMLLNDSSICYIVDGHIPTIASSGLSIVTSSPRPSVYKEFLKKGHCLWMPIWSKDEIEVCRAKGYPALTKVGSNSS